MERMWKSALELANTPIECVWFIDDDDNESIEKSKELGTKHFVAPRGSIVLSEGTNKCYELTQKDIIMCAGDDLIFRTKNWSSYVENAFNKFPDKILLCGGHDGLNQELITHPFLHKNWIEIVGRVVPGFFRDCYVDTWLTDVAKMIGRFERLPIMIEHMHFSAGKGEYDQTAQERMSKINTGDEAGKIFMSTKLDRIKESEKLLKKINEYHTS